MITYILKSGYWYADINGNFVKFSKDYIGLIIGGLVYHPLDMLDIYGEMGTIQHYLIPYPIDDSEFKFC